MQRGEWLVSGLIVGLLVLHVAIGAFEIESWPLSNIPMFAVRQPPEVTPFRMTLIGRRGEEEIRLGPGAFGLTNTEFGRQLRGRGLTGLKEGCRRLADVYNRGRAPALRLEALEVRITSSPRPGVPSERYDVVLPCPLTPPDGVP